MKWRCVCRVEYEVGVEAGDANEAAIKARQEIMNWDILECIDPESMKCECKPLLGQGVIGDG